MAERLRYVNTASTPGGDGTTNNTTGATRAYASLSECESNEQVDLVTAGDTFRVLCTGVTNDTTAVDFLGWTTGVSNGITIDGQHDSIVLDENNYVLAVNNAGHALKISEPYVTVQNLQMIVTASNGGTNNGLWLFEEFCDAVDCIVKGVLSATGTVGTAFLASNEVGLRTFKNCLAYDYINGTEICRGGYGTSTANDQVYFINCGSYNCHRGFYTSYRDTRLTNCWAMSCTNGMLGSFATTSDYNASDIAADAPGTNSQNGTAATFVDAANDDFNLASGDTVCRGNGIGPASDSNVSTTDANGNARSGTTCDIGPAEFVAGLTSVFNDSDIRWQILSAVNSDSDIRWQLLNQINNDVDFRWQILNSVLNDVDIRWSILAQVLNDSDLRWQILSSVLNDLDIRWEVQSALTQVSNDADLRWQLLNTVFNDSDVRWQIFNKILNDSDLRWQLLNSVNSDKDIRWQLLAAVFNDIDIRWQVDSAFTTVFNDLDIRWQVLAQISNSINAQWQLLNEVGINSDLRWQILNAVNNQTQLDWSILSQIQGDLEIQWSMEGLVSNQINLQWRVVGTEIFLPMEVVVIPAENRVLLIGDENRIIKVE